MEYSTAARDDLKITDLGEFRIFVSDDASETEKFAAEEFSRLLRDSTSFEVPVVNSGTPARKKILIGKRAKESIPSYENIREDIKHDGFVVYCDGGTLAVTGENDRGTLNGVYSFLYAQGFRWVYPRAREEIIPELDFLSASPGARIVNPDLEIRGICVFPVSPENCEELVSLIDWMGKNRINMLMTSVKRTEKRKKGWVVEWGRMSEKLLPELRKRGIMLNVSEHSGRYFFPRAYFDEHPEWFAMNAEGERFSTGQLCYSNSMAVDVLARNMVEYVKEHPEIDIIGTWPEDGYGFCRCEGCKKPGAVLKAVNRIARAIEKVRPDLTVEYLAYTDETSRVPPDILPEKNIAVLVANTRVARGWLKKSQAAGSRGVYQLHYHIADNTAERAEIPLRFEETAEDCRAARENGIRGIVPFFIGTDTWWRSCMNVYFMSKLSWDTGADPCGLLKDYSDSYYPGAGNDVFLLFKKFEKMPRVNQFLPPQWPLWQDWPGIEEDYTGAKWKETLDFFESLYSMTEAAENKTRANSAVQERFESIKAFIDYSKTMFTAWHERALAVSAFRRGDRKGVTLHVKNAGRCERGLSSLILESCQKDYGVNGARVDFDFFQNWRLQLDAQLLEMRLSDQKKPVVDENEDMEAFLPGLLGM